MIAKGNLHAHGTKLASYLIKEKHNEIVETRGFLADDLHDAFGTVQAIADNLTHCEKPFFHASVRLPADETLELSQWVAIADRLEKELGFDDQPRAIVMHKDKAGDPHMHVAWSRIDTERMCAIDPGLYKNKMVALCRDLEVEFQLTVVGSERQAERLTRAPGGKEVDEARRLGVDIDAVSETIRRCYDRSDDGPTLAAALDREGMMLARGDRRDFVVIDAEGGQHALGKRICGVTAADVRAKLGNTFKQSLPSVVEARALQRARAVPWQEIDRADDDGTSLGASPSRGGKSFDEHDLLPDFDLRAGARGSDGMTRFGLRLFGAAAKALDQAVGGVLDFLMPAAPLTREQVEANIEQAKREADARPADAPPPAGQMPCPDAELDLAVRNEAISRAQAVMQSALDQSQEERDRRQRDSRRDDDDGHGYRHEYIPLP